MTSFLDKLLGSFQLPKSKNPQTKREYTQHCKRCGILIKIHVCSELAKKTISASTHSDLTMRPQQFQLLYSGLLLRGKTTILCLVILPCSGFSLWFYFGPRQSFNSPPRPAFCPLLLLHPSVSLSLWASQQA